MAARGTARGGGKPKTAAKPKTETVQGGGSGQQPITFKKGGLHESLGVPAGQPIPPAKMAAALAGKHGPKAKAQAEFAKNVLTGPKRSRKKGT